MRTLCLLVVSVGSCVLTSTAQAGDHACRRAQCRGIDVEVTIDDGRTTLVAGGSTTYTILVTNSGPYTANALAIEVAFPPAFASVAWTVSADGGARCRQHPGESTDIRLQAARLPPGASCTITADATLSAAATDKVSVVASAFELARCAADTDASNNDAADTNTVTPVIVPDPKDPPSETPEDPKETPGETVPEAPKADPAPSTSDNETAWADYPSLFDDASELGGCGAVRQDGLWTLAAVLGLWTFSRRRKR